MANNNLHKGSNRERNRRRNLVLNRTFVKKTSALLSLMLVIAMMVPVLAFAATGFSNLTYRNGSVTGSVYSDVELDSKVGDAVYVNVYSPDGKFLTTTKAVYNNVYQEGKGWFYDIQGISSINGYGSLAVSTTVYHGDTVSVSDYVYVNNTSTTPGNGGGSSRGSGGGGGGGISTGSTISVSSDGSVDANTLTNALANNNTVTLNLSGDLALIPASALVDAVKAGKTIVIVNSNGSLTLPLSVLNLDDLAKTLGVEVKDMKIKVSIAKVTGETADAVKAAATALGATQVADAVDFNVVAVDNGSKTAAVDFGKTYVSRSIKVSKSVDSKFVTGVLYNETTKKVSFVPSTFATADGETTATLKRNGSSIYTVVESKKSFADVASHWSKADVELLANKLVVDGVTDTAFQPDRNITRAEFAALVVRSLGLSTVTASNYFTDVKSDAWYASTVATAAKAGIIDGYEDKTFRPDAQITREELAAMVIRAMNYADIATSVSDPESVLSKYKDSNKIVWAQKEIAAAINAGLINGMTDDTIGSDSQATRAQSATMLKRFLSVANFIN
ncbi:S-layer homology domain-containing protein [Paenibacillus sp. 32352]|uniref:S-layer homology domain-containing protein n=1 Tax=Paenibacillus sp. 32352 TaxID=1969111 RepID=UPI0009AF0978|nr:S-layer homology domain-containing protein [Paenibacillus sp. 32352]